MNIKITARKFRSHDSLKNFIQDEVLTLEKYHDNILNAEVILSYLNSKDSLKKSEIILQVPGQTLKASEETKDFSISVTATVNKLQTQLKKIKSKQLSF